MRVWTNKSNSKSLFFDGGESSETTTSEAIAELFACLQNEIIGKGKAATNFDLLLFEVNCDTGRLIAAVTTSIQHPLGIADGCSLQVQEVQNFCYELFERQTSNEEFSSGITQKVYELGMNFREVFGKQLKDLKQSCSLGGFTYRVYGSEPGVSVYEEPF